MSKELTEQWREGTLPEGYYYIKTRWLGCDNKWHYNKEQDINYLDSDGDWCGVANNSVVEIIGVVPSYDEYNELVKKIHILNEQNIKKYDELCEEIKKNNILEKRLKIATNALERYSIKDTHDWIDSQVVAKKVLKEMECVK